MKSYQPFRLVRLPRRKGHDKPGDLFCVSAQGNLELVRTGESPEFALINGACGSSPKATRRALGRLIDALNEQWDRYMRGEFYGAQIHIQTNTQELDEQREYEEGDQS